MTRIMRCPTCGRRLRALVGTIAGTRTTYIDPIDAAKIYACPEHGRWILRPPYSSGHLHQDLASVTRARGR